MRNRLVLWLILLVAGCLAGFVAQYLKAQRSRAELSNAKQQLASCRVETQLSRMRDTAAMMYLEATQKRFTAPRRNIREVSSTRFNRLPLKLPIRQSRQRWMTFSSCAIR